MAAKVFVDTNILLRALLTEMDLHREADASLKEMLRENTELWISGQVIREFIVQATHPRTLKIPLTADEVIQQLRLIQPVFEIADENAAVRETLLELLREYPTTGKQVHDANIVATMLVHRVDTLVTLNIDDMKRFSDRISLVSLEIPS
jgi:predicted nucleic acid-binding protein